VPAIAVSLHIGDRRQTRWAAAAQIARRVIDQVLAQHLEPHTVLNLNIPLLDGGAEPAGLRVVPISTSPLVESYATQVDQAGDKTFQASPDFAFRHTPPDSDVDALSKGYVTLTPLQFDLTHHQRLAAWVQRVECRGSSV
jgi:5'-nucleotidase